MRATFRPLMLSHQIEDRELALIEPSGRSWRNGSGTASACRRRIKAASGGSSRAPATIFRPPFPTWSQALPAGVVLDGELLVMRGSEVAPFNDLQQRLNRKTVTPPC